MKGFEAVIFDMDGVIVDSEPLHERAFLEIFEELGYGRNHGIHFPDFYGRSDRELWEDFYARHAPAQALEELAEKKQDRLLAMLRAEEPVSEGVVSLLEWLRPRYRLALATGSPHRVIDAVLEIKNLRRFFPVAVSVQDVGKSKPAPDIFLRAAERLWVTPMRCCVIEDATSGIEAARRAGMSVIAIANSFPAEQLARATKVVSDYGEISVWLEAEGA